MKGRALILFFVHIIIFFLFSIVSFSQVTKIRGIITDNDSKEPIPFVNISFKDLPIGTTTDFNGEYFLETKTPGDTLIYSSVGYKSIRIPVKKYSFQNVDLNMESLSIDIQEIEVLAGENPAHIILDRINENRERNNPDNINTYECEVYTKIEIDANNIDEKFKNSKAFKQLQFVFDYIDTSVVSGKTYLPIFITETLSDFYYRKSPKNQVEIIKASKVSGIESQSVSQFTGQMYREANIYKNYVEIFDQPFVSPIAGFGKLYYKYYLIDSMTIDNHWCYNISFRPKRKQEFTFTGNFWVADTSYAIVSSKIRMAEDANLNYINDMVSEQEYSLIDSTWFLTHSKLMLDFNITDKSAGFFGIKTTSYKNVSVNNISNPEIFKSKTNVVISDAAYEKSDSFWMEARHEKLTADEDSIYAMVDSIKNVPIFRTVADVVTTFVTGYYVKGNFEYGPYYTFYSFNEIEGNRIKIGGRTSNDFSKRVMYSGHLAYGFRDRKFKYGLGVIYMLGKNPRETLEFNVKDDVEQLGKSQNAFMEDNILSTLLQRNPVYKLTRIKTYSGKYEKEWFQGFSNSISFKHSTIYPSDSIPLAFIGNDANDNFKSLITSEINLNTRFAYKEVYVYGEFEREHIASNYPIVNFDLTFGLKDFIGSDYKYVKLGLNVRHLFNTGTFGYFKYTVDCGKIFGRVPYPLLRLHEGNETYAFDDFAFNMMNYYEFASDKYVSLYAEHHFMGLLLNKAPLLRKAQLREVVNVKAVIGSISDENLSFVEFPGALSAINTPYVEAGIGIENIFKILRIDAMWRITNNDKPDIQTFGIRAKLQITL